MALSNGIARHQRRGLVSTAAVRMEKSTTALEDKTRPEQVRQATDAFSNLPDEIVELYV